jgi:hypothetical protein
MTSQYTYIAVFVVGLVAGLLLYHFFMKPEKETIHTYSEKIETVVDSTLVEEISNLSNYIDSLEAKLGKMPPIKHVYLRDTVLIEPIEPKIKQFSATFPLLYGNAHLSGEVLGEVLKTSLRTDFRIPTVTNTVTKEKTTTTTIIQKGFFVGGGFSNTTDWHVGAAYLGKGYLVELNYTPTPTFVENPYIQASIKINPFSKK